MSDLRYAIWAMAVLVELARGAAGAQGGDPLSYAGSDRCRECHLEKYEGWEETFHATVVQDARENPDAVLGDFSVPDLGFARADVEYTIGGHWDQRYMKRIGDHHYVLPKLWSVQSQKWRPYNVWSWKKKPYEKFCKGCHVTAYDPEGNVVAAEERIGCEACHGPGWDHVASGGEASVVNPADLPEARADMICASCHVRGRDVSGEYYFPVGYVPGEDLGRYYVPTDKARDETNAEAIARNFEKWKADRSAQSKVRCEVCGIYGSDRKPEVGKADGALDFCFGCHDFKGKYEEHTRHPADAGLVCFDCHTQQTRELMNEGAEDIHSYGYFLVHPDNCYDPMIHKSCTACHAERGAEWARRTVATWRDPVEVGH